MSSFSEIFDWLLNAFLVILIDYPKLNDKLSMELFVSYFNGLPVKISTKCVFLSLKIVFKLTHSADPVLLAKVHVY